MMTIYFITRNEDYIRGFQINLLRFSIGIDFMVSILGLPMIANYITISIYKLLFIQSLSIYTIKILQPDLTNICDQTNQR